MSILIVSIFLAVQLSCAKYEGSGGYRYECSHNAKASNQLDQITQLRGSLVSDIRYSTAISTIQCEGVTVANSFSGRADQLLSVGTQLPNQA